MKYKVTVVVAGLACVAIAVGAVVLTNVKAAFAKREPVVEVAIAQSGSTAANIMAQGAVVPIVSTNVSVLPRVSAQIKQVLVDIGDRVAQGQALAILDTTDERQLLDRAVADEQSVNADYQLTLRPYRSEQIEQARLAVQRDRDKIAQAQAVLTRLRNGHMPQEIAAASAKVDAAQTALRQSQSDFQRNQQLFAKELISKAEFEQSKTSVDLTRSALDQAKAEKDLLAVGTRPELLREAEAAVRAAQADLKSDQAAYVLMLKGSRPEKIAAAAADARKARSTVESVQTYLQRDTVRAPISGVVIDRNINPGELTQPTWGGTDNDLALTRQRPAMFQIADDSVVEFRANVDQRFYHSVKIGQSCSIAVEAEPGISFTGKIVRMKPLINPDFANTATVAPDTPDLPLTFQVWARVPNPGHHLVMGETGVLSVSHESPGITIPQSALNAFASGTGLVYVEHGGTVKAVSVRYADVSDGQVRVLSGIEAGDHVVVSSPYKLADGMAVKTVSSDGTGATPM